MNYFVVTTDYIQQQQTLTNKHDKESTMEAIITFLISHISIKLFSPASSISEPSPKFKNKLSQPDLEKVVHALVFSPRLPLTIATLF